MYQCLCCKALFEEPEDRAVRMWHTELDGWPVETLHYSVCPVCYEDDIEEAEEWESA